MARDAEDVPWCDTCDRFYNPNTLRPDGTCPACGRTVSSTEPVTDSAPAAAPWHFKLLLAATAVYLGYRLFQGVLWVAHQL